MKKTAIEELKNTTDYLVKRVQEGLSIDTDVALIGDLQRLSELGVLTVLVDNSIPEIDINDSTAKIVYNRPRLIFKGEQEIIYQRKEIERLNNIITKERQEREELIKVNRDLLNWLKSELSQEENPKIGKTQTAYRLEKVRFLRSAIDKIEDTTK